MSVATAAARESTTHWTVGEMTTVLRDLYSSKGALAVLQIFGLDRVLAEQDDPELWAAALVRHWPDPRDPEMDPTTLRFGLGRQVPDENVGGIVLGRSGLEQLEVWCFERVDAQRLRAVACAERPSISFGMMLMSGGALDPDAAQVSLVSDYLDISRPSQGQDRALVHAGTSVPLSAGTGETRHWERAEEGIWVETEEVFSRWLA